MNKKEFGLFAAALQTYYPRFEVLPNEYSIQLWFNELKDIPANIAELGLRRYVNINKFPPSIAEIRDQCNQIASPQKSDWGTGWNKVIRAISKYGMYNESEALESFDDDITKATVKRLGFQNICTSSNVEADRANFRMIYEELSKRKDQDSQIPKNILNQIESIQLKIQNNLLTNND